MTRRETWCVVTSSSVKGITLPGRGIDGFYYGRPRETRDLAIADMAAVETAKPKALTFVQYTPANFDGISIPGL